MKPSVRLKTHRVEVERILRKYPNPVKKLVIVPSRR